MIFTSIPDNYAPITAPLLYHFDLEEERQVVDVKIIDAKTPKNPKIFKTR